MNTDEISILEEVDHLRKVKNFSRIVKLVKEKPISTKCATKILGDSCFSAVEASRSGLIALSGLNDVYQKFDPQGVELLDMLNKVLSGNLDDARALVPIIMRNSLAATMLIGGRLALSACDVEQATRLAALLAEAHPKGVAAHPDIAPILAIPHAKALRKEAAEASRSRLAICASLKNEADYLEEWIGFHARIGVDRFYLYDNASTDETGVIIERLATQYDIVTRFIGEQPGQRIAMKHFLANHAHEVEWVAFVDGDEFINLEDEQYIPDVLERFGNVAAVACSWMNFGSNGHDRRPAGSCLAAFTRRAAERNAHVKTIARAERIVRMVNPHQYLVIGETVDGAGHPTLILQGKITPPSHDFIRINHYIVKSREQWELKKSRGRPLPDGHLEKIRKENYFLENDNNEKEDTSILRLI